MPNKKEHVKAAAVWGAIIGGLSNVIKQQKEIDKGEKLDFNYLDLVGKSLLGAGLAGIGARLPDILEPANNPNHRKFFHSVAVGMGVTYAQLEAKRKLQNKDDFWTEVVSSVGLGYVVHLLQDSQTPKGLPII